MSLSENNLCEELSLSSTGTYIVEWRWSGLNKSNKGKQDRDRRLSKSDSLQEWMCPPLPGQVPVESAEASPVLKKTSPVLKRTSPVLKKTSTVLTEASPVNKSSTEKPKKCKKAKGFGSFMKMLWKAVKYPFLCCSRGGAVDVVEPFVPPAEPEPEPEPPVPGHCALNTSNGESTDFEALYDAGEMLGSGGFGKVYEGTRKFDGKRVAIKRMRKEDSDVYLSIPGHPKPLITEVALLLKMRQEPMSPYAIRLYDWFEHPRKFTLIMEFPEPCESLLQYILHNPQLEESTARVIMRQAVLAVQHCIDRDVFHNDVHANNFLLTTNTLQLKLIDFGSGHLLSSDGYDSKSYIGMVDYCPPEVFTDPLYHAVPTNVWSLGVLLYEIMNDCALPFLTSTDITQAKVTFQNSSISEECRDLIRQCLTRDPTKRPTLEQLQQHDWIRNEGL
ncbi:serine/threonine-protein kinase pim-2-like [Pseudorasbora parva]|uniref:serine/threonine-protein kinase pim-2-like n=1 Tax=Pseudorasbora parva TaxID=51549 RepID=UPI00351E1015